MFKKSNSNRILEFHFNRNGTAPIIFTNDLKDDKNIL